MTKDGVSVAIRIQTITGIARCESAETLRKVIEFAECVTHPNTEIVKTIITRPGGVERREVRAFRLGDYFDKIDLLPNESDSSASLSLIFHIREGVTSFWKDMVVSLLQEISGNVPGVKTSIVPGSAKT
jgi:hypothetical protein